MNGKRWEDLTTEEKLDWLRNEINGLRTAVTTQGMHLNEVAQVVAELEKQLKQPPPD